MIKKTNLINLIMLLILIVLISSCTPDIDFEELTDAEYKNLESDYVHAGFSLTKKGKTHYTWEKVFKDVISSDVYKKSIYAGLSNSYDLGDILYKNAGNYNVYSKLKDNNFSAADIEKLTEPANLVENATYSRGDSLSINLLLGELSDFEILEKFGADFTNNIKNNSSINVTINQYQTNEVKLGELKKILNTDKKKKAYKIDLLQPNRYLISRLVVIRGYTISAEFNQNISSDLKVELIKLSRIDSSSSNQVKFSFNGQKTIEIENTREFIPFVQFIKSKKIKKNLGLNSEMKENSEKN